MATRKKVKMQTYKVRSGTLWLTVDNQQVCYKQGDTFTVPAGTVPQAFLKDLIKVSQDDSTPPVNEETGDDDSTPPVNEETGDDDKTPGDDDKNPCLLYTSPSPRD